MHFGTLPRSVLQPLGPPAEHRLVKLSTLRTQLEIPDDSQDERLEEILRIVSEDFFGPHGLQRELWRVPYEEILDAELVERLLCDDPRWLPVSRWPVESVESVERGLSGLDFVDSESYRIAQPDQDALWRADGWAVQDHRIRYTAGYLLPGQVSVWTPETAYSAPTWIKAPGNTVDVLRYELVEDGVSGVDEPTWNALEPIEDGAAIWAARPALELPAQISMLAILHAKTLYRGDLDVPANVDRMADEGGSVSFRRQASAPFSPVVRAALVGLR